jgi:hypothetical protein
MVQKLDRVFQLIDSALRFGALVAHPQDGLRVFLAAVAGLQVMDVHPELSSSTLISATVSSCVSTAARYSPAIRANRAAASVVQSSFAVCGRLSDHGN